MAYHHAMENVPVTVIEPPVLSARRERAEGGGRMPGAGFNPTAGDVMEGTGGVRKLRWARQGGGKSGGFRVIYFFHSEAMPLFALSVYGKNEKSNLTKAERNEMKKLSTMLVAAYAGRRT